MSKNHLSAPLYTVVTAQFINRGFLALFFTWTMFVCFASVIKREQLLLNITDKIETIKQTAVEKKMELVCPCLSQAGVQTADSP